MSILLSSRNNIDVYKDVPSVEIIKGDALYTDYTFAIPTYCRAEELAEAVNSIYTQDSDVLFRVLIVDNNPQRDDETEQYVINELSNKTNLCYYKNSKNLGMAGNWNRLFELCKTKYLIMLHDDDKLLPNYLNYVHRILTNDQNISILNVEKISWGGTQNKETYYSNDNNYLIRYNGFANYWRYSYGPPTGCVFNVENVIREGGFCQETYPSIDYAFIQRMCMKYKVVKTLTPLMLYRSSGNTSSKRETQLKWIDKDFAIREETSKLLHIPRWYNHFIQTLNVKIRLRGIEKDFNETICYKGVKPGDFFSVVLFKILFFIHKRIYLNRLCRIKVK